MDVTTRTGSRSAACVTRGVSGTAVQYVVHVGDSACSVRARPFALVADLLGFEAEMEDGVVQPADDGMAGSLVVDLLDSRMISPPRPLRRRQRAVSSRAVFYGVGG